MPKSSELKIKIFADGANVQEMITAYQSRSVSGFTTNPTLMRKAGITDYEKFCRQVLDQIQDLPLSLEVFSDDLSEMLRQAMKISSWGKNVYVKIPVTNTKGESTAPIVKHLSTEGIKLNVTAILTVDQVQVVADALSKTTPAIVSVFAGRIADTGCDPLPIMQTSLQILKNHPKAELLWASPREVLNIVQADEIGCAIITVTPELLKKMPMLGTNLTQLSLETVKMFYNDATSAGYQL